MSDVRCDCGHFYHDHDGYGCTYCSCRVVLQELDEEEE